MTTKTGNTHGGRRVGAGRKPKQEQRDDIARFNRARADKECALARLREAEAGERERRLIPAAEVEEVTVLAFSAVAQTLLTLPDELERSAGLNPEQAELVERTIHNAMDGLADRLSVLAPPDALGADAMAPGS